MELDRVRLAAVAHDYDRELSAGRALAVISDWGIEVSSFERAHPALLHGVITAHRLSVRWGCGDRGVVRAVRHHTLGSPDLDEVGWIVYVADYCEEGRMHIDEGQRRHILAGRSLPQLVCRTVEEINRRYGTLHARTQAMYNSLKRER